MNPEADLPHHQILHITDELAAERTLLADERTILAYIRTALATGMSGATLLQFFTDGFLLIFAAWSLIIFSIIIVGWGLYRYTKVRQLISRL